MKKEYEKPTADVKLFKVEDIIQDSAMKTLAIQQDQIQSVTL